MDAVFILGRYDREGSLQFVAGPDDDPQSMASSEFTSEPNHAEQFTTYFIALHYAEANEFVMELDPESGEVSLATDPHKGKQP